MENQILFHPVSLYSWWGKVAEKEKQAPSEHCRAQDGYAKKLKQPVHLTDVFRSRSVAEDNIETMLSISTHDDPGRS